jgi:hypothetical protein
VPTTSANSLFVQLPYEYQYSLQHAHPFQLACFTPGAETFSAGFAAPEAWDFPHAKIN